MKKSRFNLLAAASLFLGTASQSHAQTRTKADNNDGMGSASSWVENLAPTTTDTLIWDNTVTTARLISATNGGIYGGLRILNPGGTVSLRVASSGTSTWNNNALIDMSSATQDVSWTGGTMRVATGNFSPTFNVAAGRTLTFDGGLNNQGNTKTLTMTGAGNIIINSDVGGGGAMNFNITGANVTMNNATSGWSYGTVTSGKLTVGNSSVLSGKRLTMNANSGLGFGTGVTSAALGGLEGSGSFALTSADTNAVALTLGSNNFSYTISGEISGAGSLTKVGTGTQTFTAANSYAGGTAIQGGQVNLDNTDTALGSGMVSLTNGAILRMYRGDTTDNVTSGGFANTLNVASGQSGTVYNMARGTWSGALTGSGILNLRVNATRGDFTGNWSAFGGQINVTARTGGDDWRISNYDGTTNLSQAAVNLASGVNLYMVNHFYSDRTLQIGTLSGTGNISSGSDVSGRLGNFEVGARNESSTYSGVISDSTGAAALTKVGTGTLTLGGASTYSGETTISGGTLALGAAGSIDNTSGVSLGSGGTFDVSSKGGYTVNNMTGSGNVIGALSISTELAIGNSPGTTNFSSDLTMGAASTYTYEVIGGASPGPGGADLGNIDGNLTLIAGAVLDLVQLGTYTAGNKFTLFSYSGSQSGTFAGLADDSTFTDGGGAWVINYNDTVAGANGGTYSNFVTITAAVPEPGVALLGAVGLLALLRRRRD